MKLEVVLFLYALFIWFLAGWEALLQLSGGRIRRLEADNPLMAEKAEKWIDHQDDYDVVFRIFCTVLTGAMSIMLVEQLRELAPGTEYSFAAYCVGVTVILLSVCLAEITARMILFRFDLAVLRATMPIIQLFRYSVLLPVMFCLRRLTRSWENQPGLENGSSSRPTAEDEIMSLVEKEEESGDKAELEDDERRMIKGIFDLDNTPVREIMTPRVDLEALPVTASISEAKTKFIASGHSRIPVYRGMIDEVAGVIYAKDFLDEVRCANAENIENFLHKPMFVPESKNVGDLLEELKRTGNHLALVIDEYGGLSGVVSLEDIIEEIVGDICDEYDTAEDAENIPETMPDGSISLDARYLVSDLNENFNVRLSDENADTIGGYVCSELGRIPEAGEKLLLDNQIEAVIIKADRRKIISLNLRFPDAGREN